MKKIFNIILSLILLVNCSKNDSEQRGDEDENSAPSIPQLIYPTNNLLCIDAVQELQWVASTDPDGDSVTYLLEISESINFSPLAYSFNLSSNSKSINFDNGKRYYWRVKAIDSNQGQSAYSNIFEFYTEGEAVNNYLPFAPDVISPLDNSIIEINDVTLQWETTDLDFDPLNYTVLLDTNNPPTEIISEGLSESMVEVQLTLNTKYYWRVIVNDSNGGSTTGQVWSFEKIE